MTIEPIPAVGSDSNAAAAGAAALPHCARAAAAAGGTASCAHAAVAVAAAAAWVVRQCCVGVARTTSDGACCPEPGVSDRILAGLRSILDTVSKDTEDTASHVSVSVS